MPEPGDTTNVSDTTSNNQVDVSSNVETTQTKPKTESEKTFTQAELDATIKDRLARERQKYQDYDDLKTKAAKLDELEESQKSELEKLQDRLGKLEIAEKQAQQENRSLRLQAKVATIARKLGARDVYDANLNMATQAIDPDGDGADKEIETALQALKTDKPYLFTEPGQTQVEPFNPGEGAGRGRQETDAERRARIHGGGGRIWDPETIKKLGGGVVFPMGFDKDAKVPGQ